MAYIKTGNPRGRPKGSKKPKKEKKPKEIKKAGRPKKIFNNKEFEEMCGILCTQEEIANIFGVDRNTLMSQVKEFYNSDFSAVYKRFADKGRKSLRRYQYEQSKTNPTMAIWLGKQLLGQKDKHEVEQTIISRESDISQPELIKKKDKNEQ